MCILLYAQVDVMSWLLFFVVFFFLLLLFVFYLPESVAFAKQVCFPFFHRYIVAVKIVVRRKMLVDFAMKTEKHVVVWMLTSIKSTGFGISAGKNLPFCCSVYLFTVHCIGYITRKFRRRAKKKFIMLNYKFSPLIMCVTELQIKIQKYTLI